MLSKTTARLDSARPSHARQLREVRSDTTADLDVIARLHGELLNFGPLAQLGELFIREICYGVHLRTGQMRAALYEISDRVVGFISYTPSSITFHRESIRRTWAYMVWVLARSIVQDPRRLRSLPKVMRVLLARRGERPNEGEPLGEILTLGALPTPQLFRQTGLVVAEELMKHAFAYFRSKRIYKVRGIIDADNRCSLRLCRRMGARFESYEQAGEMVVQVMFDLNELPVE